MYRHIDNERIGQDRNRLMLNYVRKSEEKNHTSYQTMAYTHTAYAGEPYTMKKLLRSHCTEKLDVYGYPNIKKPATSYPSLALALAEEDCWVDVKQYALRDSSPT